MRMNFPVKLYRVRSRSTKNEYVLATPSADTDMATDGVILLASYSRKEIHICCASDDEYELGPYHGTIRRASRENEAQGRDDLAGIAIDTGEISTVTPDIGFAFHDVVSNGYADVIDDVSIDVFLAEGGRIVDARSSG